MISFYLRNKTVNPSCYYRVTQYIESCKKDCCIHSLTSDHLYDISINSKCRLIRLLVKCLLYCQIVVRAVRYILYDIKNAETVVVQREIVPLYTPLAIRYLLKKLCSKSTVIWDIDDNLWDKHEISSVESALFLKYADKITVAADNLKILLDHRVQADIFVIPTTDGIFSADYSTEVVDARIEKLKNEISLLWIGTTNNEHELKRILPDIEKLAEKVDKKIRIHVLSGKKPAFSSNIISIEFVRWNRKRVKELLRDSIIGIMPLENTVYNYYKGGFKLIQYMSAGLPVIGDCIGINSDLITSDNGILISDEENWTDAILHIVGDVEKYRSFSAGSRRMWDENYSFEMIRKKTINLWSGRTDTWSE